VTAIRERTLYKSRSNGLDVLRIEKSSHAAAWPTPRPSESGSSHIYFCILNATLDLKLASLEARLSALSGAKFIITDQGIIPRPR
jgi:hypothetical protein